MAPAVSVERSSQSSPSVFCHPPLPEARTYDGVQFPLLVTPPEECSELFSDPSAVCGYLRENREHVNRLLARHSVLHFRGFAAETSTARDFATYVTEGLGLEAFPYALGNAVRTRVVGDVVFTANEAPADRVIPFHHELAQTPQYPRRLLFFCDMPAQTGGETPVASSPAVLEALRKRAPRLVDILQKHGVVYSRTMTRHDRPHSAIGRGWASTFSADSRADAEAALRHRGYSWRWHKSDELSELTEISPVLPAVLETDGRAAFFNQIYAAWSGWRDELNSPEDCVRAGNGEKLDTQDMNALEKILKENEVAVPWQRGDFVLIDNMQAMHSRSSFSGKRVILASLAK